MYEYYQTDILKYWKKKLVVLQKNTNKMNTDATSAE